MRFLAPERLALLAVVVGLAAGYVLLQGRRRHYAVRFTNLELLASVAPRRPGWRRHIPAGLMGLALVVLVAAVARPALEERVPRETATVMLVIDTSISMEATDVSPTRMEAAIDAARAFVERLPPRLSVGLVAFDRTSRVMASPTEDHAVVDRALQRLTTGPGTAAGEGLYVALAAIEAADVAGRTGNDQTAAIVLLSDGVTTVGRPVELAAVAAAEQGVPVSTIAFGTDSGTVTVQGRIIPVPADPETMRAVARTTGGSSFEAFSAEELKEVYDDIGTRVGYEIELREIASLLSAIATLLLLGAVLMALIWTGRIL